MRGAPKASPYQKSSLHDGVLGGVIFLWRYSDWCVAHALVGDQRSMCIFTVLTGLSGFKMKEEKQEEGEKKEAKDMKLRGRCVGRGSRE